MSADEEMEAFARVHPHPWAVKQRSLFRFSSSAQPETRLAQLFVNARLYHSLPSQFNDPFEAKPHFRWPCNAKDLKRLRRYLNKVAKNAEQYNIEVEEMIAQASRKGSGIPSAIEQMIRTSLGQIRICSFTGSKDNLLFWAHYADSHRGFCVEYDATVWPIAYAFKVEYSDQYPEASYPPQKSKRALKPLLVKSSEWAYEKEFRTIFLPKVKNQPNNDGESLILSGDEIINVYLGALMDEVDKNKLLGILKKGPFNPNIWQARLSGSAFKIEFEPLCVA